MRQAPTGSGKTLVAVERAAALLRANPAAKTVFLTTTIALAPQQAGEHIAAFFLICMLLHTYSSAFL